MQAERAFEMRGRVRETARGMMTPRDRSTLPARREAFRDKVNELTGRGLTEEQAYRSIITSSGRTNREFDRVGNAAIRDATIPRLPRCSAGSRQC
jgi:hypothetical protein